MDSRDIIKRRALLKTGAAFACVFLAGCSNNAGGESTSAEGGTGGAARKKITLGYNPVIAQPQALVGVANGDYAKALSDVTFSGKEFGAGPAVLEALRGGTIDIGCSGPFPAIKAFAKEGDVVLLCGAATGGTELSVKDPAIKSVRDLKGKTIGVNQLGSTVETMVRYQVLKAGLKPETDVKFIKVDPAEQAEALESGDVQAVAAPAPWPSFVQINAGARPLLDSKAIYENGNYLSGSFFATKKWVEANPELARQFVAATQKVTDALNADRAKGDAQVLAAWEKVSKKTLDPKVAKKAFGTIVYTTAANEARMQKFADINHELGVLKQKPDLKGFVWK